jgi:porphobilinogen synthase
MLNQVSRPRRLRQSAILRDLIAEVDLSLNHLIQPYFVTQSLPSNSSEPIRGFTDVCRWGVDALSKRVEVDIERGIRSFLLFGDASKKDEKASEAYSEDGAVAQALKALKRRFGTNALLFTDVCLCAYTSHGHCGLVESGEIANDPSLDVLSKMALLHAEAGADVVAPSDMMDGRIGCIREILDKNNYQKVSLLSYTAKYASSYYGPFREAVSSSPQAISGIPSDRCTYQMDFRNATEALRELRLDIAEGADMVMVKPALAYLDIVAKFKAESEVPVAAYSVSGEYEMVKQMARLGLADEKKLALENLMSIRRAGATAIVSYFSTIAAEKGWLPLR